MTLLTLIMILLASLVRYGCEGMAVKTLDIEKLSDRRTKLCLNFAKKCEKHPKYSKWFQQAEILAPPQMPSRSDKNTVQLKYTPVL